MDAHSGAAGGSEWSQAGGKSNGRTNEEVSHTHTCSHRDPRCRTSPHTHTHTQPVRNQKFPILCNCFPPVPFPSLSLSYLTNCCWTSAFLCSRRNISVCSLVNNAMPLPWVTQARRCGMNNADFPIDGRVLLSPALCWDVISTLTWHAVFTDVL